MPCCTTQCQGDRLRRISSDLPEITSTQPGRPAAARYRRPWGAKNHAIIMPDADQPVVDDLIVGYSSAGRRCMVSVAVPPVTVRWAVNWSAASNARADSRSRAAHRSCSQLRALTREHHAKVKELHRRA